MISITPYRTARGSCHGLLRRPGILREGQYYCMTDDGNAACPVLLQYKKENPPGGDACMTDDGTVVSALLRLSTRPAQTVRRRPGRKLDEFPASPRRHAVRDG